MKPNFALRLAHDSIELLQRSPGGWLSVGTARLDASDLDSAIGRLRDHAERLSPEGVTTKLIIPDTELRYETVLAPGPDDAKRKKQIEAAIDGLTPYALDELVYDWVVEGDHAMVVIAARETLSEAEDFAAQHGLNPVSFVATPEAGAFLGEPFFGATRHAARTLPAGTRVLPDVEPVQVSGQARIPAAQTMPASPGGVAKEAANEAANEAAPETAKPEKAPEKPATPEIAATADPRPMAPARSTPFAEGTPADPRKRLTAPRAGTTPMALRRPGAPPAATTTDAVTTRGGVGDLVRRLGTRLRRERAAAVEPSGSPSAESAASTPEAPARREPAAAPAFASRRKPGPALVSEQPAAGSAEPGPGGRIAVLPKVSSSAASPGAAGGARTAVARMGEAFRRRLRPSGAAAASGSAPEKPVPSAAALTTPTAPTRAEAEKEARALDRAAPKPPARTETIVPKSRPPASEKDKAREAESLTIFGARSDGGSNRDFAQRGLMMTGGLLLLLVALGAWVAYFAGSPEPDLAAAPATEVPATEVPATELPAIDAPATAAAPEDPVAAPPPLADATMSGPETLAQAPAVEDVVAEDEVAAVVEPPAEAVTADARMEALVEEALRQGDASAQFSEPEISAAADTGEPETAASGESLAAPAERLALPGPLDRPLIDLPRLVSLPPPPPFGTEMQLGADGLVVATPEGAMTPEGVTVFARPPNAVPPARPASIVPPAPEVEAPAEDDASAADAVEPPPGDQAETQAELPAFNLELEVTPGADPALAGFRPVARPQTAELVASPEPAAEADDISAEAPAGDDESRTEPGPGAIALAAQRPNQRPESLCAQRPAAAPATPTAPEIDLSSATPQAVARSLRPSSRPQDFAASVQRALAAAARSQPQASPQAVAQPQAAPQQTQTAAAQPRIPTAASVAETATERRAINLRRVNLIGIFGAQSNRRALVRMPNGQVVRVQVGDTLDGGRVSAIGDTELRYVRGGRNQILRVGQSG